MKKLFCPIILFVFMNSFAQLYVKTGSYIFNKGQIITVSQNIDIESTANFYLRNGGQLIQKTTSSSLNAGPGKLSVFQEGTVNNFAYNYWCSPVGNASSSTGNENFGVSMLGVPTSSTSTSPATILPYNNSNGTSSLGSLSIAQRWIYRFLSSSTYSQWLFSGTGTPIAAGQGFTMKGTSGSDATNVGESVVNNIGSSQRYDFAGKPNDGNITINVNTNEYTLTGNPYPSAIDLNAFLTDASNSAIDGTALFWEQAKTINSHNLVSYRGGYGTYNGLTSVYTPATFYTLDANGQMGSVYSTPNNYYERRFSPIGQGFIVRGISAGTVQMKNYFRVFVKEGAANYSQFEKSNNNSFSNNSNGYFDDIPNVAGIDYTQISSAPTPHIVFNTSLAGQAVRQIAICFLNNAIDGVDKADSKSPDEAGSLPMDMYLILNNEQYIHSTTSFSIEKRFPVGFSCTNQTVFTVFVKEFVNFNQAENVYLYDNVTGMYYDIKNSPYQLTLPSGVYNNRFEITFLNTTLDNSEFVGNDFVVAQDNQNQTLIVENPNKVELKSIMLFDINGKIIFNQNKLETKSIYEFSTSNLSDAVYIVRVESLDGKNIGKKLIISNKK